MVEAARTSGRSTFDGKNFIATGGVLNGVTELTGRGRTGAAFFGPSVIHGAYMRTARRNDRGKVNFRRVGAIRKTRGGTMRARHTRAWRNFVSRAWFDRLPPIGAAFAAFDSPSSREREFKPMRRVWPWSVVPW